MNNPEIATGGIQPYVAELNVYPVKGCRGISLNEAELGVRGLRYDRNWMIVTEGDGLFISQRDIGKMAQIVVAITEQTLSLTAQGIAQLAIPIGQSGVIRSVRVWDDVCEAVDEGDPAGKWLTDFLGQVRGQNLRLVRMLENFVRPVDSKYAGDGHSTGFADGFPILVVGEGSVAELNEKLLTRGKEAVSADRFRANLVLAGLKPGEEDRAALVEIANGEVKLECVKPCSRCVVITKDQKTGEPGADPKEPTATLASYRRNGSKILFGQNAIIKSGAGKILRKGDAVILREKTSEED